MGTKLITAIPLAASIVANTPAFAEEAHVYENAQRQVLSVPLLKTHFKSKAINPCEKPGKEATVECLTEALEVLKDSTFRAEFIQAQIGTPVFGQKEKAEIGIIYTKTEQDGKNRLREISGTLQQTLDFIQK